MYAKFIIKDKMIPLNSIIYFLQCARQLNYYVKLKVLK